MTWNALSQLQDARALGLEIWFLVTFIGAFVLWFWVMNVLRKKEMLYDALLRHHTYHMMVGGYEQKTMHDFTVKVLDEAR